MKVFYSQLAQWWPLLSPVHEYQDEAREILGVLEAASPSARTMLELGSGGGHLTFHFRHRFNITFTDLSPDMLAVCATRHPGAEHIVGDMRTLRLGRSFDVVLVHDAIDYMTTESDLSAAIATAYEHCRPGGIALFVPDAVQGEFASTTDCGGTDAPDGRGIRYLEWSGDLDASDTQGATHYSFLVRQADGRVQAFHERHAFGLFSKQTWLRLLGASGFSAEAKRERTAEERPPRWFFVGRRSA